MNRELLDEYWHRKLDRNLNKTELKILKRARCEKVLNRKLKDINDRVRANGLFVPYLPKLDGNCIFESLKFHGLCENTDDFRKGLSMLMIALKDKKYFIPNQELSLNEIFNGPFYDYSTKKYNYELVHCTNKKKLYLYNFVAMCIDLACDTSWDRLHTQLVFTVLALVLNIKIMIYHNDTDYVTSIEVIKNDKTINVYFGQIDEFHYIPLDSLDKYDDFSNICPEYNDAYEKFTEWKSSLL